MSPLLRKLRKQRQPAVPVTREALLAWHARRAEQEAARRRPLCDRDVSDWKLVPGTELKP